MKTTKNRWLIALSGVGIHVSIGSVYAYSVMTLPLKEALGWEKSQITMAFSIAIVCLGLAAAFLGQFVEKYGPRISGMLCAVCYGLGTIGAGFAVHFESIPLFIATYGVLGGIGLGGGYITPVSTLVKWFPDRRGLATGMAIMGFGFASMIFGPTMAKLFEAVGPANTFWILGAVYFCLIFGSALYIAPPPKGWMPANMKADSDKPAKPAKADLAQLNVPEALRTSRFYYLWLMLFINITCGIAVISVASPMAQEMVGMMGLFNGIGRIGWASFSDYIGHPATYIAFFIIQISAFIALSRVSNALAFQGLVLLILTCYGGGFATVPAFLGDVFGTKQLSAIHGCLLTAWAAAGLVGPTIVTQVQERTGSYTGTLMVFAGLFVVALITSCLLLMNIKKLRAEAESCDKAVPEAV